MSKKTDKKTAKKLNAKMAALVTSATSIGYNVADGFSSAVVLFRSIGAANERAVKEAGANYVVGYVTRYLSDVPAYAKRWGNMGPVERLDAARDIIAKPTPESAKAGRRTELEHKAVRAAATSLSTAKRRAGIVADPAKNPDKNKKRAPRTGSNEPAAPPVDLVKASPTLKDKEAVNDYFATACAALLTTVNKNAKKVDPRISSAVEDFHAAMKLAGFIPAAE